MLHMLHGRSNPVLHREVACPCVQQDNVLNIASADQVEGDLWIRQKLALISALTVNAPQDQDRSPRFQDQFVNRFGEFGEIAKIIAGRLQANQQTHEIAQMAVILAGCSTSFKVLWKAGVSKLKRDAAVERLKDFVSVLASNDALWMAPKFEETRLNIPGAYVGRLVP